MNQRRELAPSSTDGVILDDLESDLGGISSLNISCSYFPSVEDDDESLIVNDNMTQIGCSSIANDSSPIISQKKTRSRNQTNRFRGLSKSASSLLEQDEINLSELLDVDPVQNEPEMIVHRPNIDSDRKDEPKTNSNQNYLRIIQNLERELEYLETESKVKHLSWEQNFKEQKNELEQKFKEEVKLLEQKYLSRIHELEREINSLKNITNETVHEIERNKNERNLNEDVEKLRISSLTQDQLSRYSRQLLLRDGWGVEGQKKLLKSKVLVVGAGGIGSTLCLYLAAAGVGSITVADFDAVEISNLHRQVIHRNQDVGLNKAVSACKAINDLNPTIQCTPIQDMLTFENAMDLVGDHDCIVDACDNPQTRYLINDACILSKKPLVSGSAVGTEGQMSVYGYNGGTCYRCMYPTANQIEGNKSCSDSGVLGPVPGLIGVLQATETLKLLSGLGTTLHDKLLMYDSLNCTFISIKKPASRKGCKVCSDIATIKSMQDSKALSRVARGPLSCTVIPFKLPATLNISCKEYYAIRLSGVKHILLDVRVKQQYNLCSIEGAINIELADIENELDYIKRIADNEVPIYCICRRGIASIEAVSRLSKVMYSPVYNIEGGLNSWVKYVDPNFPMY